MSQVLEEIKKTKKVDVKTAKGKKARIAQLADILGMINHELENSDVKALLKQQEMAKKEMQALADEVLPEAKGATVKGKYYMVEIGKKSMSTQILDLKKAIKMLGGWEKAKDGLKMSVGYLKDYLNPEQLEKVTKQDRSGARPVKIDRIQ